MTRRSVVLIGPGVLLISALLAYPALGSWCETWNCNLRAYWGGVSGAPADTGDYFGAQPLATDYYDLMDCRKPPEPVGNYVYAWFDRAVWGQGPIMCDWRCPIAEGATKRWGSAMLDTWNVKTSLDNGPSGVFDECFGDREFPIAASMYISWEFGAADAPPYPVPPEDYMFSLIYRGGINPKPTGTKLPDAITPPTMNTAWDIRATPHIVVPLWNIDFRPYLPDCSNEAAPDTARFWISVYNPPDPLACTITATPSPSRPATFAFTAEACCDPPFLLSWDFGDGAATFGHSVSHTYAAAGEYTVTCTARDCNGDTQVCTTQVIATPCELPVCCFTYAPVNPLPGDTVQFRDCSTQAPPGSIISWAWTFGDGSASPAQNPTHQFPSSGRYTVCLTVTNDYGWPTTWCDDLYVVDVPAPQCCISGPTEVTAGIEACWEDCTADPHGQIVSRAWHLDTAPGQLATNGDFEGGFSPVNYSCDDETGVVGNGWRAWQDGCWGEPYHFIDSTAVTYQGRHAQGVEFNFGCQGFYNQVTGLTPGKTYLVQGAIRLDSWACRWAEFGVSDSDPPAPGGGCLSPDDCCPADPWLWKDDGSHPPYTWYLAGPYRVTPTGTLLIIWYKFGNGCHQRSVGYGDAVSVMAMPDSTDSQFCKTFAMSELGAHTLTLCATQSSGATAFCTLPITTFASECDVAIDRSHCQMPAAGHVGQCKTGQIGAKNLSYTVSCEVVLGVTDNAGNLVFESEPVTIGPGRRIRLRFHHCYTADEVGCNLWAWEVWPVDCRERSPWDNVRQRRVNVYP